VIIFCEAFHSFVRPSCHPSSQSIHKQWPITLSLYKYVHISSWLHIYTWYFLHRHFRKYAYIPTIYVRNRAQNAQVNKCAREKKEIGVCCRITIVRRWGRNDLDSVVQQQFEWVATTSTRFCDVKENKWRSSDVAPSMFSVVRTTRSRRRSRFMGMRRIWGFAGILFSCFNKIVNFVVVGVFV
jgi:hypothetical protein